MRLRRTRRRRSSAPAHHQLDSGWVLPRQVTGSATADPVAVGTLGAGVVGAVDERGSYQPAGASWTLEWWIGAEDRWHHSGAERGLRQQPLGRGPLTETTMRVPGGEIVHRVGAVHTDPAAVAIELENRCGVPVALAVVARPFDLAGAGRIERVRVHRSTLDVDGVSIRADRTPAGWLLAADEDIAARLASGALVTGDDSEAVSSTGAATGALVVPLTHASTTVVTVSSVPPAEAPPPLAAVERGWADHLDAGAEVVLPTGGPELDRDLGQVLLAAAGPLAGSLPAHRALARLGHPASGDLAARLAVEGVPRQASDPSMAVIEAAARHADPSWFDDHLGWVLDHLRRSGDLAPVLGDLVPLLDRLGHHTASLPEPSPAGARRPGSNTAAGRLIAIADGLVRSRPDGLDLLSRHPRRWSGQSIDVRALSTPWGRAAYSVRWHGTRPALLWEVEPWPGQPDPELRCPGLDPGWSSTERRGEALLAGPDAGPGGD